jgi:hypothetical protein
LFLLKIAPAFPLLQFSFFLMGVATMGLYDSLTWFKTTITRIDDDDDGGGGDDEDDAAGDEVFF